MRAAHLGQLRSILRHASDVLVLQRGSSFYEILFTGTLMYCCHQHINLFLALDMWPTVATVHAGHEGTRMMP